MEKDDELAKAALRSFILAAFLLAGILLVAAKADETLNEPVHDPAFPKWEG